MRSEEDAVIDLEKERCSECGSASYCYSCEFEGCSFECESKKGVISHLRSEHSFTCDEAMLIFDKDVGDVYYG